MGSSILPNNLSLPLHPLSIFVWEGCSLDKYFLRPARHQGLRLALGSVAKQTFSGSQPSGHFPRNALSVHLHSAVTHMDCLELSPIPVIRFNANHLLICASQLQVPESRGWGYLVSCSVQDHGMTTDHGRLK
jgi:hypothetical protein